MNTKRILRNLNVLIVHCHKSERHFELTKNAVLIKRETNLLR